MIDFKQLEAFFWVAELNSFSAAAEKLHATQSSISQRILNFEDILGVKVFDRSIRGIRLTEKGQELLSLTKEILEQRETILRTAKSANGMKGVFLLGVVETLVHTWLPDLVEYLHTIYPDLIIEIHVDTSMVLKEKLLNHQLDLVLIVGRNIEDSTNSISVGEYPLTWCASSSLNLNTEDVSLSEIAKHPIITYPVGSLPHAIVKNMLEEYKINMHRIYASASLSTMLHMIEKGMGSGVLPEVLVETLIKEKKLHKLNLKKLPSLVFYAHWLDSPNSHTAKTIAKIAHEIAEKNHPSIS